MSLPSYQEVADKLHSSTGLPQMVMQDKRPTRRGLGRFVAFAFREYHYREYRQPEWWVVWRSAWQAHRFLLTHFHIQLPHETFKDDRARVRYLLAEYKMTHREPDTDIKKAEAWASK